MRWTKNFGKPEGLIGRLLLNGMNSGHTSVSKWGLSHYEWQPDTSGIDIGCGGGMNVKRMLTLSPKGKAFGIDISDESVRKSRKINRDELGKRCNIEKAGANAIPYNDESFDVATAFETVYFWPDVTAAFREVKRILKPGGSFLVICEMSDPDTVWSGIVENITIYRPEQLKGFFEKAGFRDIEIRTKKAWICVKGQK